MKQSNIEDFSSILRQLIESTGLSIYEISRATKISYQALNQIRPFAETDLGNAYEEAVKEGKEKAFDEAIDIFARSIVNSATIMAPDRIVLTGDLFASERIRQKLIAACGSYDEAWGQGKVVYSELWDRENYLGPVAICAKYLLF